MSLLGLFAAFAFSMVTDVRAQTPASGVMLEIAFDIPIDTDVRTFNVEGCNYLAPSLAGTELTLKCPLSQVYKVGFSRNGQSDVQTRFGMLQIRPDADGGVPLIGALHYVGTYASDYDAGLQGYKDLPKQLQPLLLAGVADVATLVPDEVDAGIKIAQAPVTPEQPIVPPVLQDTQAPPQPPSDTPGIDLSWDASYGSIRLNGSKLLEETQEVDGLIQGRMILTEDIGNLFILSSDRNPNCNKSYSVEQLQEAQEVFFDCTGYTLSVPFKLPLVDKKCQKVSNTEISCLIANSKKTFKIALEGWSTVEIAVEEGVDVLDLPLSALQPVFPATSVLASLTAASADQCEPKQLELRLGAYCLNDICNDLTSGPQLIDQSGALPGLGAAGWDIGQLPNKVKLIVVNTAGDVETSLGEEFVPLGPVPVEAVTALIKKATGDVMVPLRVDVKGKIYKVGRSVRFFSDAACEVPLSNKILDLSNPGNQVPDVPKCSFHRIFDRKQPRSECTAIAYDKETETSSAVLEVASCGSRRLLIYVAENETLNGRNSKSIVSALAKLANGMNDRKVCAPIDIVHTVDEKREVLFSAEDMWFTPKDSNLRSAFNLRFVNANSEILRDLEWVYRKWGDTLGGLIVIADGAKARPIDMTDSPASMAWKIKDVYRRVVNFSAAKNCDVFKDIMLFDECKQGEADTFDAVLSEYIGQGLEALAQENK